MCVHVILCTDMEQTDSDGSGVGRPRSGGSQGGSGDPRRKPLKKTSKLVCVCEWECVCEWGVCVFG